jgi:molybdopterin-guanine dinucleotide biosynthesis protein A
MRGDVAVVILAGGQGRRMGGGKPLKRFGGERLIDRALSLARRWSDRVAIAIRDPSQVSAVRADMIPDEDVPGPLGGLISGMKFASSQGRQFLLAIPADMPFLPGDLLDRLLHAIGDRGCALAESRGQIHPVCSLWRVSSVAEAERYAAWGRRSLKGLAASVGFVAVEWRAEPVDPFFNINTSDDLAEAARRRR